MTLQAFRHGRIFTGEELLSGHAVLVEDGRVRALVHERAVPAAAAEIDLHGMLLAPGFIDLQVNGGAGVLFNDQPTVAGVRAIAAAHRRGGTTTMLPTLISDRREVMEQGLAAIAAALRLQEPGILGIHLEGPYLNPLRRGVHPESALRAPEADAVVLLGALRGAGITLVTLAPEQVPAGFIRALRDAGVMVAIGHSAANYAQVQQALREGAQGFTHLFNAMSSLNSREPGVVGAALADPDSWCGLIVDGHHVHPATLQVALRAKPRGKMLLVTDAVHGVGAAQTTLQLLGQPIVRADGRVSTPEGVLAGSDLSMAQAVRNAVGLLGLPLVEALRMASLYPAQALNIANRYGRIAPGHQADMVLLDEQLQVVATWIRGAGDDGGDVHG